MGSREWGVGSGEESFNFQISLKCDNKVGDELGGKLRIYQQMRVSYYIVYDPTRQLGEQILRIYELRGSRYYETTETWLEQVGLGLIIWEGEF